MQPLNEQISDKLREAALLLETQGAEPFRARAFSQAADTIAALDEDIGDLLARVGPEGLQQLPHIGKGIAQAVAEMAVTGRWTRLDRLRGELDPVRLFCTVPGIGPALAERIHDQLHVDTLAALEASAHDGRLEKVPGVGPRRALAVRAVLSSMLNRVRTRPGHGQPNSSPPVTILLEVDREYRRRALQDELERIAPKRFNPKAERWLPIMHTRRGDWHFTALYSNTARAHELGRTHDWVVLYYYDGDHDEGQCTIVTETRGKQAGRRVVRGREAEGSSADTQPSGPRVDGNPASGGDT